VLHISPPADFLQKRKDLAVFSSILVLTVGFGFMVVKLTKCGIRNFGKMVSFPLVSGIVMVTVVFTLKVAINAVSIWSFLLLSLAGVFAYLAVIHLLDNFLLRRSEDSKRNFYIIWRCLIVALTTLTYGNEETKPQAEPDNCYNIIYDTKERFCSYWHQIQEVLLLKPSEVLEIGIGNGFVSRYLKERGINVTTLDIDKELKPDVVGSVLDIPFHCETFQVVACYEVLEHLPYEDIPKALSEISRVSKQYVILSVPDVNRVYRISTYS